MLLSLRLVTITVVAAAAVVVTSASDCDPRSFGADSFVCVCSADYCDNPGTVETPSPGYFTTVTSSRDGLRFSVDTEPVADSPMEGRVVVQVNASITYQTMMGFGGAFTDSTGISVKALPEDTQDMLLRSYFSPEGIEYNLCRVPMAGSDFSTRPYSYDDVEGDVGLQYFNLTQEDYEYKLPLIRRGRELAARELLLLASPWSPPAWMKENGMFNGTGGLLREMWQPWADYFVKFVATYEAEDAPVWGITPQNEPLLDFEEGLWNGCAWMPEDQRDWIRDNLGPTLEATGLGHLKLVINDHSRKRLPWYPATILEDPDASKYVDGVGVHWYNDDEIGPGVLDETHFISPDKFLLYTESCEGSYADADERVVLGAWYRAENYAVNIIEDVNHWSTGWIDWNMVLDLQGGPNWVGNFVDSPVIVDKESRVFYKQPMFYALGHFSKFVQPGSQRVALNVASEGQVHTAAFLTPAPTPSIVTVLLNTAEVPETVTVSSAGEEYFANFVIPAKSFTTILLPPQGTSPPLTHTQLLHSIPHE